MAAATMDTSDGGRLEFVPREVVHSHDDPQLALHVDTFHQVR